MQAVYPLPFIWSPLIATRDAALFLPYRSAFRNVNNIVGLPTLIFRLMGREIAVDIIDSVSVLALSSVCKRPALRESLTLRACLAREFPCCHGSLQVSFVARATVPPFFN